MNSVAISKAHWQNLLRERLPLYGHRNWIVIADSAYPAQSRPGIETILVDTDQIEAIRAVLAELGNAKHVKPIVYTDRELNFIDEADAPGISSYRQQLTQTLAGAEPRTLPHEDIIRKLDESARCFNILIFKTKLTIPYTSVFLELDCAYWNADAEKRLRSKM